MLQVSSDDNIKGRGMKENTQERSSTGRRAVFEPSETKLQNGERAHSFRAPKKQETDRVHAHSLEQFLNGNEPSRLEDDSEALEDEAAEDKVEFSVRGEGDSEGDGEDDDGLPTVERVEAHGDRHEEDRDRSERLEPAEDTGSVRRLFRSYFATARRSSLHLNKRYSEAQICQV